MIFYKKTKKQKLILHWSFIIVGIIAMLLAISGMGSDATKAINPDSIDFENIVQAKVIFYKLKIASCLIAIGSVVSYILTLVFTNSPLGSAVLSWDDKDNDLVKTAKTRNLGLVYCAFVVSVFFLLSTVLGK